MNDRISILIEALLSKTTEAQLEQQLRQVEKKLTPIKVEVDTDAEMQIKLHKSLQKIYKEEESQKLKQQELAEKALADKEKQLQYEQKVRKAIEENIQAEKNKTLELEKQIQLFQKKMQLESSRISGKYGTLVDSDGLSMLNTEIGNLSTNTPDVNNKMKTLSLGMKEIEVGAKNSSKALKLAQQDATSWGNELVRSATKFTEWYLLAGIITTVIGSLKNSISVIYELDTALVGLKKVTDETDATYKSFLTTANTVAKNLAVNTTQVIDATTQWVKAGNSFTDAQKLAQSTLIGANVGDVSVEEMQSYLVAPLKAYNIEADRSIDIVSKMNNISNKHAITITDLGQAYNRASSVMAMANNSIDEFTGLVTAAQAQTQMGGDVIGNALKC